MKKVNNMTISLIENPDMILNPKFEIVK